MKVAVVLLFVAIGAVSAASFSALVQNTQPLKGHETPVEVLGTVGHENKNSTSIFDQFVNSLIAQAQAILAQVQEEIGEIGGHIGPVLEAKIEKAIKALKRVLAHAQGHVQQTLQTLIDKLQQILDGNNTQPTLPALIQLALQALSENSQDFEHLAALIEKLQAYAENESVQAIIEQLLNLISDIGRSSPKGLGDSQELRALIRQALQAIVQHSQDHEFLNNLIEKLRPYAEIPAVQNIIDKLVDLVSDIGRDTSRGLGDTQELRDLIRQALRAILENSQDHDSLANLIEKLRPYAENPAVREIIAKLTALISDIGRNAAKGSAGTEDLRALIRQALQAILENSQDHEFLVSLIEKLRPYAENPAVRQIIAKLIALISDIGRSTF